MNASPIDFNNWVLSDADKRLWDAVDACNLEDMRAAVAAGGNLDMIHNYKYPTPLISVAMYGDENLELLKEMVAMGATLNLDIREACPITSYNNAFEAALFQSQYKAASLLIDLGADINMDKWNFSQLVSGDMDTIEELALAKKMFDHGALYDDSMLADLRKYPPVLYFLDNYWEDGALKMADIVQQWMHERAEQMGL